MLDERRHQLRWRGDTSADSYRLFGDLGTGYGVFIDLGAVSAETMVIESAASGRVYAYQLFASGQVGNVRLAAGQVRVPPPDPTFLAARLAAPVEAALASRQTRASIIPAPTPLPTDALLLGLMSDATFQNNFNTLTVVGEIRNDATLDVGHVSVVVSFYDQAGNFLTRIEGEPFRQILAPGDRAGFRLELPTPTGMSNYSIKAVGRPVPPELPPQVVISNSRAYEDGVGFYRVVGTVKNVGVVPIEGSRIVATLYGRGGGVINVNAALPNRDVLVPGQEATFDIAFTYFPYVFRHEVVVQAP